MVQMNIDGVDASVSGITECPVPDSWATVSVPGEATVVWHMAGWMNREGMVKE